MVAVHCIYQFILIKCVANATKIKKVRALIISLFLQKKRMMIEIGIYSFLNEVELLMNRFFFYVLSDSMNNEGSNSYYRRKNQIDQGEYAGGGTSWFACGF